MKSTPELSSLVQSYADVQERSKAGHSFVNPDAGFADETVTPRDNIRVITIALHNNSGIMTCFNNRVLKTQAKFVFAESTFVQIDDNIHRQLSGLMQNRTTIPLNPMHLDQSSIQLSLIHRQIQQRTVMTDGNRRRVFADQHSRTQLTLSLHLVDNQFLQRQHRRNINQPQKPHFGRFDRIVGEGFPVDCH